MLKDMEADSLESTPSRHPELSTATGDSGNGPNPLAPTIAATAPGEIKVIKRNGSVVPYHDDKISVALTKAFLAVEGGTAAASPRIRELVGELTTQVSTTFERRFPSGGTIHIEDVQDQVELVLMRSGEHKVARDYVLYREERAKVRAASLPNTTQGDAAPINVKLDNGSLQPLDMQRIRTLVTEACANLTDVDAQRIVDHLLMGFGTSRLSTV